MFWLLLFPAAALAGSAVRALTQSEVETGVQLKPGAVLRISRTWYWHYGVYVGGDEVIHYTSKDGDISQDNVVQLTRMSKFIGDISVFEILDFSGTTDAKGCFGPLETARRAREKIGENAYSLSANNCQHFAIWCKTGQRFSGQMPIGSMNSATLNKAIWPDFIGLKGITIAKRVDAKRYDAL